MLSQSRNSFQERLAKKRSSPQIVVTDLDHPDSEFIKQFGTFSFPHGSGNVADLAASTHNPPEQQPNSASKSETHTNGSLDELSEAGSSLGSVAEEDPTPFDDEIYSIASSHSSHHSIGHSHQQNIAAPKQAKMGRRATASSAHNIKSYPLKDEQNYSDNPQKLNKFGEGDVNNPQRSASLNNINSPKHGRRSSQESIRSLNESWKASITQSKSKSTVAESNLENGSNLSRKMSVANEPEFSPNKRYYSSSNEDTSSSSSSSSSNGVNNNKKRFSMSLSDVNKSPSSSNAAAKLFNSADIIIMEANKRLPELKSDKNYNKTSQPIKKKDALLPDPQSVLNSGPPTTTSQKIPKELLEEIPNNEDYDSLYAVLEVLSKNLKKHIRTEAKKQEPAIPVSSVDFLTSALSYSFIFRKKISLWFWSLAKKYPYNLPNELRQNKILNDLVDFSGFPDNRHGKNNLDTTERLRYLVAVTFFLEKLMSQL